MRQMPSILDTGEAATQTGYLAPSVSLDTFCLNANARREYLPALSTVSNYRVASDIFAVTRPFAATHNAKAEYFESNDVALAIRSFDYDDIPSVLLVNARTCRSGIADTDILRQNVRIATLAEFDGTLLSKVFSAARTEEICGAGCTDSRSICIVVDMCQSSRDWDPSIFNRLISIGEKAGTPVHITVAPAGRWIIGHLSAFLQLIAWHKKGLLDIEWANHTMNHALNTNAGGDKEFLCSRGSDLILEALALEILLLEQGVCPSIWFRFPGNKYTRQLLMQLSYLSLVPLGITSWLERGDEIQDGSTVLVHANGNDRSGVLKLDAFLREHDNLLQTGKLAICKTHDRLETHR